MGDKAIERNDASRIAENLNAKRRMFVRMVIGALEMKRSRLLLALASITTGAAVVSSMTGVYLDISSKMNRELKSYGPNVVLVPRASLQSESSFPRRSFDRLLESVPRKKMMGAAPYLFGVADGSAGGKFQRFVIAGTEFARARKISPYWRITGSLPREKNEALVGSEVAQRLELEIGESFRLYRPGKAVAASKSGCTSCHQPQHDFAKVPALKTADTSNCVSCHQPHPIGGAGKTESLTVAGIVSTGGEEDGRVFVDIAFAHRFLGKEGKLSAAYLSLLGTAEEVKRTVASLEGDGISVQLIKRISESEGKIIYKVSSLFFLIIAAVLFSTALCVAITTVAMTLERRREIGLKKALGAEDADIFIEFVGESLLLGLLGGLAGWIIGYGFAQWIGRAVFESSISLRPITLPLTLAVSLAVTALASLAPTRVAAKVNPAIVLKEE